MRKVWDEEYTHVHRTDKPVFLHAARHLTLSDNSLLCQLQRPTRHFPSKLSHTQLLRLLIEPNHVFIIPAQHDLHVLAGEFRLKPISKPRGWPDVITVFLRSLTEHWDGKLIAVIVSGYDGDGAAALRGIKEAGGTTIAQKLDTAAQPDMPESAIASGYVDLVLSPENIAKAIVRLAHAVD